MSEQLTAYVVPCSLLQLNGRGFFLMVEFFHASIRDREDIKR